ncbi:MarR family transcriptional regulator [Brachybacterium sp. GPGPB12]|uniref:MarR family winged helix-turn-helix transcriptional regulator n=1 Tax=Brachybacterium sp. GPGPB12 TaxID=3023517 RepID=UPI0031344952
MDDREDGEGASGGAEHDGSHRWLYDVDATDPLSELVSRDHVSREEIVQIGHLMSAMADLRRAEEALALAGREYMRLGTTDMKAIQFLIVSANKGEAPTASTLSAHLGISNASVTKALDRLERGGHIERLAHPTDRRSRTIRLSEQTKAAAMASMGRAQAQRFHAAASLTADEREVVTRFLQQTAADLRDALGRFF